MLSASVGRVLAILLFFCISFFPQQIFCNDNSSKIISVIAGYRGAHGKSISEKEFFEITGSSKAGIGFSDVTDLWKEFQKSQIPPITKKDLLTIVKTARVATTGIQYNYVLLQTPVDSAHGAERKFETGRYAISNNKVYISVKNDKKNDEYVDYIMSFDGTVVRFVNLASKDTFASIEPPSRVDGTFFPPQSLLSVLSMLDTKRYYGKLITCNDFVGMLESDKTIVLEEREFIDDEECIIVTDGNYRTYVSPSKNYSIVRKECWVRHSMPGDRVLLTRAVLKNFCEYMNSLWLPKNYYEEIFSEDGKLVSTIQVDYSDVVVSSQISEQFFQDVIPDDAFVVDGTQNMTYFQGDRAIIDGFLKETAKSKRVWIFQVFSMALVTLMIIVVLIRMYLKRK